MVHSRLPFPSLLGLFAALLMLSPDLLMWSPEGLTRLPVTDAEVQKALGFAVERYNQKIRCANYFKQLRLQQAYSQEDTREEYHLKVELVLTTCIKRRNTRLNYEWIQICEQVPRNPEKRMCYFKVRPRLPPNEIVHNRCLYLSCTFVGPLLLRLRILSVSSSRATSGVQAVFTPSFATSDTNQE